EGYIAIGINHGWQPIHGPVIASSIIGRTLKSINWEAAFKYYKNIVEKDTGIKLTAENFLELAESHPLGLLKYDNEIILRVPIMVDTDNNILLGSEIHENSMLMIMKGYPDKLIEAAGMAAEQARIEFKSKKRELPTKTLVIDCITRALFLKDRFTDELKTIEEKAGDSTLLFGFLSLGEIASKGDKYIELHNKTVVIGMGG
ncbi:FIST C-terminal domain-containing protein, partial [candidate division WOR-3 bacterium]|nr:FIST C-terminal domain-containing protein [candidate division WOR-3 bacterium]